MFNLEFMEKSLELLHNILFTMSIFIGKEHVVFLYQILNRIFVI